MKVAVSSAFWDNPSGDDLEPWLDEVKSMGFDGVTLFVDYWTWGDGIGDGQRLINALEMRDLGLASVVTGVGVDFKRYRQLCGVLRLMGCKDLILIGGTAESEAERATLATVLNQVGRIAREERVIVAYHHHTGTAGESFAEVNDLLSKTDPNLVGLAFDSGHAAIDFFDLPPERRAVVAFQQLWKRIGVVELKEADNNGGLDLSLGDGVTNAADLLSELVSRHYGGWVTVEQNPELPRSGADRRRCASRSLDFVRSCLPLVHGSDAVLSGQP